MRLLTFILLATFLVASSACSKSNQASPGPALTGEYQLRSSYGGWAGVVYRFTIDSVITLRLDADSSFVARLNGHVTGQGHYLLNIVQTNPPDTAILFIQGKDTIVNYMSRSGLHMNLSDGNMDGFSSDYLKVRD